MSAAIWRNLDRSGLAALRWLGYTLLEQGDLHGSRHILEECIAVSRAGTTMWIWRLGCCLGHYSHFAS
jgi:hypothetical protein